MEELQKLLVERIKKELERPTYSPALLEALNHLLGTVSGFLLTERNSPPLP